MLLKRFDQTIHALHAIHLSKQVGTIIIFYLAVRYPCICIMSFMWACIMCIAICGNKHTNIYNMCIFENISEADNIARIFTFSVYKKKTKQSTRM